MELSRAQDLWGAGARRRPRSGDRQTAYGGPAELLGDLRCLADSLHRRHAGRLAGGLLQDLIRRVECSASTWPGSIYANTAPSTPGRSTSCAFPASKTTTSPWRRGGGWEVLAREIANPRPPDLAGRPLRAETQEVLERFPDRAAPAGGARTRGLQRLHHLHDRGRERHSCPRSCWRKRPASSRRHGVREPAARYESCPCLRRSKTCTVAPS